MILVPFPDAAQVSGSALIINDEWHDIMEQALLKQNESANTTIAILEGENLLKPNMEI